MRSTFWRRGGEHDGESAARMSARAEAQARAKPVRRLQSTTIAVFAVGLVVTAGLVIASAVVHDHNESRLLQQRSHEAATVAASSISGLQGRLTAASVAAESDASGSTVFRQVTDPLVGPGKLYVSASIWPRDGNPQPSLVVGAPPLLEQQEESARRNFLSAAASRSTVSIRNFLQSQDRRLGYAYAVPNGRFVVYLEAELPAQRRARIASDSAFADLDYALYLGMHPRTAQLLASSTGHGLSGSRTASDHVPFGDSSLLVVLSARGQLGGALLAALPWILGTLGLLLTFVAAFLAEHLARGRRRAEELSTRLEEVAEENAALYVAQRQIAEQLQRSLMPRSLPRFPHLEAAARYEAGVAGTEVGGDWYDVLPLSDRLLVFSVGDVCGRGLAAAARMAALRYSIRAYALEHPDPATILSRLAWMVESTEDDAFATVICGTIDTRAGVLTVARAGHLDLLAIDAHGARYLDVALGPALGVDSTWDYEATTLRLANDVMLVAFTDGLVERRNEHLDVGLERLRGAAEVALPLRELVAHLVDSVAAPGVNDDIALLGLHWTHVDAVTRRSPLASLELSSSRRASHEARIFVREAFAREELDGEREVLELLTAELVSNVVKHVGSQMEMRVFRLPAAIRVEIDDASTRVPKRVDPDLSSEHGRGILLVDELSSAWGVDSRVDGKTVWFEVETSAAPDPDPRPTLAT